MSSLTAVELLADEELQQTGGQPLAACGEISAVVLDSRRARSGTIWVALPGEHTHGARHAGGAFAAGVSVIVTDAAGAELLGPVESHGPAVLVSAQPRLVMARTAARLAGQPAAQLTTYGVTGTNGKTTTTYLIQAALRAAGERVGLIGTVGFRVDDEPVVGASTTTVTTPESPDLQGILADMVQLGATSLAMEVSSHALALQRVAALCFDVAGFNNLGVDHLDFHHDLEDYFAAKASLFSAEQCRHAVINIDDSYGRRLRDQVTVPVTTVSLDRPDEATIAVLDWRPIGSGSEVTFRLADGTRLTTTVGLPGEHNVRNALLAIAMVAAQSGTDPTSGIDLAQAATGFATATVPGRMEPVGLVEPPTGLSKPRVYVDFAHTPQAVLAAGHAVTPSAETAPQSNPVGPVVIVVGSGGDRDPSKRAPIGAAAAAAADVVIVTDDNARSEDPAAIRAEILAGAQAGMPDRPRRAVEILDGGDRRSAIRSALEYASVGAPGTVLILGRGHETQQLTATGPRPFHDATVAAQEWTALVGRGETP